MIFNFCLWYFLTVPEEILKAIKNFLEFGVYFFSPSFLLKTYFQHWHKLKWAYPKGIDPVKFFETFLANFFSRVIGVFVRSIFIFVWLVFEVLVILFGAVFIFFWILILPFSIFGLIYGIKVLF